MSDIATSEVTPPFEPIADLAVVHSSDRAGWHAARRVSWSATTAKKLTIGTPTERMEELERKLRDEPEAELDNQYINRGKEREPVIARWIETRFGIQHNEWLFHHREHEDYTATPDGVGIDDGALVVTEIKTSKFDVAPGTDKFASYGYEWQMQWQMLVTGAVRCLYVWEQHDNNWPNPSPLDLEPGYLWVERDDAKITRMVDAVEKAKIALADLRAQRAGEHSGLAFEDVITLETEIDRYLAAKGEAAAAEERIRSIMDGVLGTAPIAKYQGIAGTVSLSQGSPRTTFDTEAFDRDHPGVRARYMRKGAQPKPTMRITPSSKEAHK